MVAPNEKLAQSLVELRALQQSGAVAIRASDLTRTHRDRLRNSGFIKVVMKGWYIASQPGDRDGDTTPWHTAYWGFCSAYLSERFGDEWVLSSEQSLMIHAGNRTVPDRLFVRSPRAHNNVTEFLHGTTLLESFGEIPDATQRVMVDGLYLFSVSAGLVACSSGFHVQHPTEARAVYSMIRSASEVLPQLLHGGRSVIAGRLAGGFRNIGRNDIADEIVSTMRATGYTIREKDPFESPSPILLNLREVSPYVNRMRLMWEGFRDSVINRFSEAADGRVDVERYLESVDEIFVTDAYNSLSIEGYRVSRELIERARRGEWDSDSDKDDREQQTALAVRGYWQAFQLVRKSVESILRGDDAGMIVGRDHGGWYREMFAPGVTAGILKPSDLAGYRSNQVYIRGSKHVPPNRDAVRDIMPALFDLASEETNPAVRAVLGHFFFVYTHPYQDGNGRIGRFLMNAMLASGGYPWTVVPLEKRDTYMSALEAASTKQNIGPLADCIGRLVKAHTQ